MNTELLQEIEYSHAEIVHILNSFNEEQLNSIPFKDSWTAGQVGEHLIKGSIVSVLYGKTEATDRPADEKKEDIKKVFLDFSIKMNAPEFIVPSDGTHNKERLIKGIEKIWTKLKEAAQTLDLSEVCLDFSLPGLGNFTRMEFIYFYAFHTQRHIHQLKKIFKATSESKGKSV